MDNSLLFKKNHYSLHKEFTKNIHKILNSHFILVHKIEKTINEFNAGINISTYEVNVDKLDFSVDSIFEIKFHEFIILVSELKENIMGNIKTTYRILLNDIDIDICQDEIKSIYEYLISINIKTDKKFEMIDYFNDYMNNLMKD